MKPPSRKCRGLFLVREILALAPYGNLPDAHSLIVARRQMPALMSSACGSTPFRWHVPTKLQGLNPLHRRRRRSRQLAYKLQHAQATHSHALLFQLIL